MVDLWHASFAARFTEVQEQPPYVPPIEQFGGPLPGQQLSIVLTQLSAARRLWFLTEDGQELLQLQRDWFACNWRKVGPESEYERWPSRRDAFSRWYREFEKFVAEHRLGAIQPTQCEVTYINSIPAGDISTGLDPSSLIRIVRHTQGGFLPAPEQTQFAVRYPIPDDKGIPIGRLHVELQPALNRADGKPLVVLNLTARGRPYDSSHEGVLRFLEQAREWVVKGFAELTTEEMQRRWERYG